MWLIELLTIEVMIKKPGYWKEISNECGLPQEIEPNDELSLTTLIEMQLMDHREKIEEISKKADKQYQIEKMLNEMSERLKEQLKIEVFFKNTLFYLIFR